MVLLFLCWNAIVHMISSGISIRVLAVGSCFYPSRWACAFCWWLGRSSYWGSQLFWVRMLIKICWLFITSSRVGVWTLIWISFKMQTAVIFFIVLMLLLSCWEKVHWKTFFRSDVFDEPFSCFLEKSGNKVSFVWICFWWHICLFQSRCSDVHGGDSGCLHPHPICGTVWSVIVHLICFKMTYFGWLI